MLVELHSWYAWTGLLTAAVAYTLFVGSRKTTLPFASHCTALVTHASQLLRRLLVRIIRQGHIPAHVAFIMDGNRRYARSLAREARTGHVSGFFRLAHVLDWCNQLGIAHVSVFAFAINNFSRSPDEVRALMELAQEKLRELAEKSELVRRHRVRICVVGNRALLSQGVREAAEFAEASTKGNAGMRLNICFPYSATDEIAAAVRRVAEDVKAGVLDADRVDERVLDERMLIGSPDPDILVRTSGQVRFSNFMLWQSARVAHIQFIDVFWPNFSFFHMFCILVSWQLAYSDIHKRKQLGPLKL
ncbi:cis-prenyltransferase [Coemansia erecta]|nr:cis-prenyltransferase [Coemansia erecta]